MKLPVAAVRRRADDEVVLDLAVSADNAAFAGHFPDYPVLPGVVQLDWAIRFCAAYLSPGALAARDIQIKFRNVIVPDVPLSLSLRLDRVRLWLSFTYESGETAMSSGLIKLGA